MTLLILLLSIGSSIALLPPAPYHFQLRCLSGHISPSLSSCNSSSTACAFFYSQNDESKGHYTCVDESAFERTERNQQSYLVSTCGPTPGCSLLPPFSLTNQSYHRFGLINSQSTKFCCSLFYNTLVKLVEDVAFHPKEPSLMTCGGEDCDTGAVGCLVYAKTKENIREEWNERRKKRRKKRQSWDGVNAIEVSFGSDEDEAERIEQKKMERNEKEEKEDFGEEEEEEEYSKVDEPVEVASNCVYRHLQDEFYKYCLLVHSKNDPLKCTAHLGYTVCCCFVFPGASTCDPTRVQKPKSLPTLAPRPSTTSPPPPPSSSPPPSTTPSTTTSSSTTTPSTTSTTTSPISTSIPQEAPKCDVEYVHQLGGRTKMRVVCSSPSSIISLSIITLLITRLLW
ncbi:hypothetical protein PENTCL1PPCAC_6945 [Pristionchus entomophagus]|uniref:Uncharacterized protein n=1 Tax=Pristionchus entomophagus TaxID=358040 RepID=A0AAV5SP27_9BILA|nr:hypothetical protein PENTCL1PPCAC_6945 [Pristionchus entomophagus]